MKSALAAFLALISGCAEKPPTYYQDIRPLMERHCVHCHSGSGVSFSFEDAESSYQFRGAIAAAVSERRMPPWMAEAGHQNYRDDPSLSADEFQTVAQWAKADFVKGEVTLARIEKEPATEYKANTTIAFTQTEGFLPDQTARDDYHCFVARWPEKSDKYISGIHLIPGNQKISHHAIIYAVSEKYRDAIEKLSKSEEKPGYRCFGGPTPDRFSDSKQEELFESANPGVLKGIQTEHMWIAHWAPGMDGYSFPEGTGILIRPGTVIILQIHYFTGFKKDEHDPGTRIEFQTKERVVQPGFNWPLTRQEWLYSRENKSLVIPALARTSVSAESTMEGLDQYLSAISGMPLNNIAALELHSANLHMHLIGASGKVQLTSQSGVEQTLLRVPRYEFGWQRDYQFNQAIEIPVAELKNWNLKVTCEFANPKKIEVYGGFGSEEEMCYNFSFITARQKN